VRGSQAPGRLRKAWPQGQRTLKRRDRGARLACVQAGSSVVVEEIGVAGAQPRRLQHRRDGFSGPSGLPQAPRGGGQGRHSRIRALRQCRRSWRCGTGVLHRPDYAVAARCCRPEDIAAAPGNGGESPPQEDIVGVFASANAGERLRRASPSMPKPASIIAQVVGSGADENSIVPGPSMLSTE